MKTIYDNSRLTALVGIINGHKKHGDATENNAIIDSPR